MGQARHDRIDPPPPPALLCRTNVFSAIAVLVAESVILRCVCVCYCNINRFVMQNRLFGVVCFLAARIRAKRNASEQFYWCMFFCTLYFSLQRYDGGGEEGESLDNNNRGVAEEVRGGYCRLFNLRTFFIRLGDRKRGCWPCKVRGVVSAI